MFKSITFIGITVAGDLSWHANTKLIVKKSQQQLFFLRRLKDFKQNSLLNFNHCIIKTVLTCSLTVWFGNVTVKEWKSLNRVVRLASKTTGVTLLALEELCPVSSVLSGTPQVSFFDPLPFGRRYLSIKCSTTGSANIFFPSAVRSLNDNHFLYETYALCLVF